MPSHSHGIKSGYGDIGSPACTDDAFRYQYWGGSNRGWHEWLISAKGGNGKHNTLPCYNTVTYYRRIKQLWEKCQNMVGMLYRIHGLGKAPTI